MKTLTLCIAAALISLSALCKPAETGAVPGEWTMDFDAARKVAAEQKIPIFINFTGSDWCTWCKHMEKEVFSKKEWMDYAKNSLMLVWIDFPKNKNLVPEKYRKRNQLLSKTFEIKGYPAYVILDDNGQDELGTLQAEKEITPNVFISKMKLILLERDAATEELIASMSKKEGAELKKAFDERATARKELNELRKKELLLGTKLTELDNKISELRTKTLVDKLTPAKASQYRNANKELAAQKKKLNEWIATKPPQDRTNRKKFEEMSGKIAELEKTVSTLLFGE